jgi:hypothetical protein
VVSHCTIGQWRTQDFVKLELESKWVAALLSGRAALPSEEDMMADVQEEYQRMEDAGKPKRHATHCGLDG